MIDLEIFVKTELIKFINTSEKQSENIDEIDDIILQYLVGILEEISPTKNEIDETFCLSEFVEMMEVYFPNFSKIDKSKVEKWILELVTRLNELRNGTNCLHPSTEIASNISFALPEPSAAVKSRTRTASSTSTVSSEKYEHIEQENEDGFDPDLDLLTEMFPSVTVSELTSCLCVANGDVDKATQLVLHRQETGEISAKKQHKALPPGSKTQNISENENQLLKKQIIDKYSYVPVETDKVIRTHKPVTKDSSEKKLIRYREGQIVSTKGERFSEIKKPQTDEMKKTFINLKPAKQYRFH